MLKIKYVVTLMIAICLNYCNIQTFLGYEKIVLILCIALLSLKNDFNLGGHTGLFPTIS